MKKASIIKCALPFFLLVAPLTFAATFSGKVVNSVAKTSNGYLIGSQGTLGFIDFAADGRVFKKSYFTFASNPTQKVYTDNQPLAAPVIRIAHAIGTDVLGGDAEIDTDPNNFGYGLNQLTSLSAMDNSGGGIANRITLLLITPYTLPSNNMYVLMGDGKSFYPTTTEQAQILANAIFRHKPITYTTYCGYVWNQSSFSVKFSNQYNSPVGAPGAAVHSMCGLLQQVELVN